MIDDSGTRPRSFVRMARYVAMVTLIVCAMGLLGHGDRAANTGISLLGFLAMVGAAGVSPKP